MPKYRVRAGQKLPHNSEVLESGTVLELPRQVAEDSAVRPLVEPIDETGAVITLPTWDPELEQFQSHERLTILRDRALRARDLADRLELEAAEAETALQPPTGASTQKQPARLDAPDEGR